MLTHIFRPINYSQSPVTSICSNNSTLVAFKRNGTCDFIESSTSKKFLTFELKEEVNQSFFLDLNMIIGLTATNKVILLDISSLELQLLDLDASNIAVEFNNLAFAPRSFFYSTLKNEIFQFNDFKTTLITTIKSKVTSLLSFGSVLAVGTTDGWISILINGKLATEIEIKTKPTSIRALDINSFVITGENGWVYLINPISEIVMDKIQIRESALNALAITGNFVHVSGADSRMTCLSISKNKIIKLYQGDSHSSEVLCMCTDNNTVISSGEDCSIVLNTYLTDKYSFRTVFDSSIVTGTSNDYFFTAFDHSFDLFNLKESVKNVNSNVINNYNDLITFKINESILENINQKQTVFDHFVKITVPELIISADISKDQKYVCISTSYNTYVYSLFTGSKLNIEKLRCFAPSKCVKFNGNQLVMQGLDLIITILDLSTFNTVNFPYKNFKEEIQVTNEFIFLALSKVAYNFKSENLVEFTNDFANKITSCSSDNEAAFYITEDERGPIFYIVKSPKEIQNNPIDCKVDLSSKADFSFKNIAHSSGNACVNSKYLFILKEGKVDTYEIGNLILGVMKYGESIVVVQMAYKQLVRSFKKGVFKQKFSNK